MNQNCKFPGCWKRAVAGSDGCYTHGGVPKTGTFIPTSKIFEWPPAAPNRTWNEALIKSCDENPYRVTVRAGRFGFYRVISGHPMIEAARRRNVDAVECDVVGGEPDVDMVPIDMLSAGQIQPWGSLSQMYVEQLKHSPILITADGEVVDGKKRVWAAMHSGVNRLPCIIKPAVSVNPECVTFTEQSKVRVQTKPAAMVDLKTCRVTFIPYKPSFIQDSALLARVIENKEPKVCIVKGCGKHIEKPPYCESHKTPSSRGLVRCIQPDCKVWINEAEQGSDPVYRNCRKHKFSEMPLFDRDGDPIWFTANCQLLKVSQMKDDHLTNTILMLERNAARRAEITGGEPKLSPRYPFLVAEAKGRDASGCNTCVAGLVNVEDHILPCSCKAGKAERAARDEAFKISRAKRNDRIKMLLAACVMATLVVTQGEVFLAAVVRWLKTQ